MAGLGVAIRHKTERSTMVLVPLLQKPLLGDSAKKKCPGCHVYHGCKTVHVMVNDTGLVIVSEGVLADLRTDPNFEQDWEFAGEVKNPPTLHIDGTSPLSFAEQRQKQDQAHRQLIIRR